MSPDGKRLAVAGEDEKVRILDVDARQELKTLPGHPSRFDLHEVVCAVAWSPDGKRLAAASPDGTYLLWDTDLWEEVLELRPPDTRQLGMMNPLGALTWSRDGRRLAFFGNVVHHGSVLIWDAATDVETPARQQDEARGAADPGAKPAPPEPDENRIAAALAKVGAGIKRDEKQPGKPVVWVDLTNKTKVTDADLKDVKYLKSLQTLNLGVTRATDACLEELKGLKALQALQVPLTQVTDKGLEQLKGHHGLQILNLAGTRVTNAGLEHLKGLGKLRLLDLTGTHVTDVGATRIRQALPQCRVVK
jgi:WD40 repeat protein